MVVYADGGAPVYEKMKPELKAKWLEALRSGKYTQGPNALKKKVGGVDAHCCLGVLADLMVAEGICESRINESGDGFDFRLRETRVSESGDGFDSRPDSGLFWVDMMPSEGMERAAGLDSYVTGDLADMNDAQGKTFAEIADYIEEHL